MENNGGHLEGDLTSIKLSLPPINIFQLVTIQDESAPPSSGDFRMGALVHSVNETPCRWMQTECQALNLSPPFLYEEVSWRFLSQFATVLGQTRSSC